MDKYHQLAELKKQISDLKEEADVLQAELLEEMITGGILQQKTTYGTFSVGNRKNWNYPEYVREVEEEVKLTKKKAQRRGDAEYSKSPFLSFRAKPKEEIDDINDLLGPSIH